MHDIIHMPSLIFIYSIFVLEKLETSIKERPGNLLSLFVHGIVYEGGIGFYEGGIGFVSDVIDLTQLTNDHTRGH